MRPLKESHNHEEIQTLKPIRLVDLRDYGLEAAAPCEDGQKVLVFRVGEAGALLPVA